MDSLIFCLGPVALFIIVWLLGFKWFNQKIKEKSQIIKDTQDSMEDFKVKYLNSLYKLKSNSSNAELKQQTLSLGREYASLTRKLQGVNGITVVDEVSIMNDINAVSAIGVNIPTKEIGNQTIAERLAKLTELKAKNLINEQEYETRRQKILDEI